MYFLNVGIFTVARVRVERDRPGDMLAALAYALTEQFTVQYRKLSSATCSLCGSLSMSGNTDPCRMPLSMGLLV